MHIYILHVCNYSQFSISKIAEHTPERDPLHFGRNIYVLSIQFITNFTFTTYYFLRDLFVNLY